MMGSRSSESQLVPGTPCFSDNVEISPNCRVPSIPGSCLDSEGNSAPILNHGVPCTSSNSTAPALSQVKSPQSFISIQIEATENLTAVSVEQRVPITPDRVVVGFNNVSNLKMTIAPSIKMNVRKTAIRKTGSFERIPSEQSLLTNISSSFNRSLSSEIILFSEFDSPFVDEFA